MSAELASTAWCSSEYSPYRAVNTSCLSLKAIVEGRIAAVLETGEMCRSMVLRCGGKEVLQYCV